MTRKGPWLPRGCVLVPANVGEVQSVPAGAATSRRTFECGGTKGTFAEVF